MRNTKQKDLVFEIIENSRSHLTAQQTYEIAKNTINNISLGTVYRILNCLADNHKILRITTTSGIDHFDRIPDSKHSHFICDKCGVIFDIYNTKYSYDKSELNEFDIRDVEIIFTGICKDCMKGRN